MKQEKSKETNQETVLANTFAKKYYGSFSKEPEVLHKFYKDHSTVTISSTNKSGSQDSIQGTMNVQEAFIKLGLNGTKITLSRMNIQQSINGLLFLSIQGVMTSKSDHKSNKFTQSFILARQENGFYILNDIFHLFEDEKVEGSPETKQEVTKEVVTPTKQEEVTKEEPKKEKKKLEKKEVEKKTPHHEKKKKEEKPAVVVVEEKKEEKHDPNQPTTYASIVGTIITQTKEEKKPKENGEKKKEKIEKIEKSEKPEKKKEFQKDGKEKRDPKKGRRRK